MTDDDMAVYFSGQKLYGDDFDDAQIGEWYEDEAEGYAELGASEKQSYNYSYHRLNYVHAFRYLKGRRFQNALGLGSAYGDEFKPIAADISQITILDPSDAFSSVTEIDGTPCRYKRPNINGDIDFESHHFDLITSLGVLHHIPNVSHVLSECYRCLSVGGVMLLREPIVSMGDWRFPRGGLTKRERGIPLQILDDLVVTIGFKIVRRALCVFRPIPRLADRFGIPAYNNAALTLIDSLASWLFSWNVSYHRTTVFKKLAPAAVYYLLEKHRAID